MDSDVCNNIVNFYCDCLYGGEFMKKLKLIVIFILVFIGIKNVSAFDNTLKVYDYAQVLTPSEETNLKQMADNYINTYNMDMVLVTVKYHQKYDTKTYAQDFYDYNNFGIGNTKDGIIFVIDFTFGYTDIYISTTGEAIRMYDDYRINRMLDNIAAKKDDGYFAMFKSFVNDSSSYASMGVPSSNSNTIINEYGDIVYKESIPWPIILLISIGLPTIVIIILISKNKMIKRSLNAAYYLKDGSVSITTKHAQFVTTHTSSVRISDSSSSGGSGRVGGSSVSRGSSGRSHGGGGRRL